MKFANPFMWQNAKPFNMDAATLERINDKMSAAMDAGIQGNQVTRFRALKIIWNNSHFKIQGKDESEQEKKNIELKIKKINDMIKQKPLSNNRQTTATYVTLMIDSIELEIDLLEKELNTLLFKYDVIHLKVQKMPHFSDEIKADYE